MTENTDMEESSEKDSDIQRAKDILEDEQFMESIPLASAQESDEKQKEIE